MDFDLYYIFIMTCVVLGLIPGPNIAYIVANSVAHGTRYGLVSVFGTSSAMVPQLAIMVFGATTLLTLVASAFEWLRWIGVFYLIYLGLKYWFLHTEDNLDLKADRKALVYKTVYWRGFLVSVTNPKTLLFFGAFLPQFVSPHGSVTIQMIVLSVTFVTVITFLDSCWAITAGKAYHFLPKLAKFRHRVSGLFYMIAGAGLALARRP